MTVKRSSRSHTVKSTAIAQVTRLATPSGARHPAAHAAAKSALRRRIAEVREGLPLAELDRTAELLGIDRAQLASILDTSLRTLQRKAEAEGRLGPAASDRLARIKRIHELATHVLGERDKASRWLTAPTRGLGGEVP